LNSIFEDKVVNDHLRYIDWNKRGAARPPAILLKRDFGKLANTHKLFARKFDTNVDSEILDMIDKNILNVVADGDVPWNITC
jgi:hypothetical protein